MNEIYLWLTTVLMAVVAASTISRLWSDRHRLWCDHLLDEDRAFAWRIVLFLIYPALVFVDLRATMASAQLFGGSVYCNSYGVFWYSAVPHGIANSSALLLVLFAGVIVQLLLAVCLLPSLIFRPHPFLSTVIGYTVSLIFTVDLLVEPVLALFGIGGSRWHLAYSLASGSEKVFILSLYLVAALTFVFCISRQVVRLWFADLSRPLVAEKLRDALMQERIEPHSIAVCARLSLLYEQAGLMAKAKKCLRRLQMLDSRSLYTVFSYAVLQYRQRRYKAAREAFLLASDFPYLDTTLKGSLLAAAGCSAFAQGDTEGALNLSERALEFDDASLVARMVKVDVFLKMGKKKQAGDEIILAMRRGLDMDLETKIPLDIDKALLRINRCQQVTIEAQSQPVFRR